MATIERLIFCQPVLPATALSMIAVALFSGCGEEQPIQNPDKEVCLVRADMKRFCIDVYEASRKDASATSPGSDNQSPPRSLEKRLPWVEITWDAARRACEAKGKRLCETDEWIGACSGSPTGMGTKYTYGDTLDPDGVLCNTKGTAAEPTGKRATCKSPVGTFDQSGNVWEWTGNAASVARARGGGWASDRVHECKSDAADAFPPTQTSPQVGFRCCRTQT